MGWRSVPGVGRLGLCFVVFLVALVVAATARAGFPLTWGAPVVVEDQPPFTTLNAVTAVSCASSALCVAVDSQGNVVFSTDPAVMSPTWSAPINIDGDRALAGVSCPSTRLCVAVDGEGNVMISTDPAASVPSWSAPANVDYGGALTGISCASVSLCVAVDGAGDAVVSRDPAAGSPTWSAPANIGGAPYLSGVSCAPTSVCVAVGGQEAVSSADPAGGAGTWAGVGIDQADVVCGGVFILECPARLTGVS